VAAAVVEAANEYAIPTQYDACNAYDTGDACNVCACQMVDAVAVVGALVVKPLTQAQL